MWLGRDDVFRPLAVEVTDPVLAHLEVGGLVRPLRSASVAEPPDRRATVVNADLVGKIGPGEVGHLQVVVEELDQLTDRVSDLGHLGGLFGGVEVEADVVDATSRRADHRLVVAEAAREVGLGGRRLEWTTAVGHRLAAAGLIGRIPGLDAQPLEELQGGDRDLGKKGIDVARNEKADF